MYGLNVPFILAKHKDIFDGQPLLVQTAWPHIVARIHRFNRTEREEQLHQTYLQKWKEGNVEYAKAEGVRMYVELIGVLEPEGISRSRISRRLKVDGGEYPHDVLNYMTFFLEDQLKPGQRYAYDDSLPIVSDEYFKEMKKHRKENKATLPTPHEGESQERGLKATAVYMDEFIPSTKEKASAEPWMLQDGESQL